MLDAQVYPLVAMREDCGSTHIKPVGISPGYTNHLTNHNKSNDNPLQRLINIQSEETKKKETHPNPRMANHYPLKEVAPAGKRRGPRDTCERSWGLVLLRSRIHAYLEGMVHQVR
jgi:hypothetical protein